MISDAALQADIAAWLVPLPGGVSIGPMAPLNAEALAERLPFVRPPKVLTNPRRCAAAIYRHIVRHGGLRIESINDFPDDADDEADFVLNEEEWDALDWLAAAFIAGACGGGPSADDVRSAREMAGPENLVHALIRSVLSRSYRREDFADAFAEIAFLMLETMDRRTAAGYGGKGHSLDEVSATINDAVRHESAPEGVQLLARALASSA